ncbi:MAG: phosphoribosylanthranilate isomerase [Flammeovirgaceae bacterium]|nr:phosphoribosylanthranilate isomerase [Flammeovirgaceae bacterium]
MEPSKRPRVKICCISSKEEAKSAIAFGASALGLVAEMPSGPGVINDKLIKEIAGSVPPPISTFLLTSRTNAKDIIEHHKLVNTNTIQIVDTLNSGTYQEIKMALPGIKVVQVIHVVGKESIDEAIELSQSVDAILLDSGNPNLAVKELGGTGRTHNWELSKKIRESLEIPIFLAGGLRPENVKLAIETVQPFGLDLCSGVRTNGTLDNNKLEAFFNALGY